MALLGLDFNLKKTIGIVVVLLVASFFLGFGAGYKAGSGSVRSSNAGTLSPEERKEIEDAIKNAGRATATPSPTPASNESFADRLKRQREEGKK
jgi:hypothetical protein